MVDIFTHALVGFSLAMALSFHFEWLNQRYITVAMLGALVPDLTKVKLIVSSAQMELLLGVPFDWRAIHTLGGVFIAVLIGGLLTSKRHRKRVLMLLFLGSLSHLFLDMLLINPTGFSYPVFWPLTSYHPPTPGLYLSSDRWPAVVMVLISGAIWFVRDIWESAIQE